MAKERMQAKNIWNFWAITVAWDRWIKKKKVYKIFYFFQENKREWILLRILNYFFQDITIQKKKGKIKNNNKVYFQKKISISPSKQFACY